MKRCWVRQGMLYGAIIGLFWVVFNLMNYLAPPSGPFSSISRYFIPIFFLLITPLLYGAAGFSSGQRRRAIRAGTYAGLLTAVIGMAIFVGSIYVIVSQFMDTIRENPALIQDFQSSHFKSMDEFIMRDSIGSFFSFIPLSLVEGALLGTLCGFFGVRRPRLEETVS